MSILPIYTIWYKKKGEKDAVLINDEPLHYFPRIAFKRAKELSKMDCYQGCYILVRKIRLNSYQCREWKNDCDTND